jgi:hypothetical protein
MYIVTDVGLYICFNFYASPHWLFGHTKDEVTRNSAKSSFSNILTARNGRNQVVHAFLSSYSCYVSRPSHRFYFTTLIMLGID